MKINIGLFLLVLVLSPSFIFAASENIIEKQLEEIGSVPNEEVIVVQRKYTRKNFRSELTPLTFGGVPFGTVRRTLVGGAAYTLHFNDWLAWQAFDFLYTKNFFSSFTSDINNYQRAANVPEIKPDYQKLLFFLTTGIQISPFYGKFSSFSRWIAYAEPYLELGLGDAKTEVNSYFAGYWGVGLRSFFREWVSMQVSLRDVIYNESSVSGGSKMTQNWAVMASFSFWLPKMPR